MWQKVGGGLRSLKALEFEKWGLEPSTLTEIYAYGYTQVHKDTITHIVYLLYYFVRVCVLRISSFFFYFRATG